MTNKNDHSPASIRCKVSNTNGHLQESGELYKNDHTPESINVK